jgi:MFS family permease
MYMTVGARGLLIPLYADHLGATKAIVGWLFSTQTIMAAVAALPTGMLIDRLGSRRLLLTTLAAYAITQCAAGFTSSLSVLFLLQGVAGLAQGSCQTALMSTLIAVVSEKRLGSSLGWLVAVFQGGIFVGPAFAGLLLARLTLEHSFLFTAAPVAIAFVVALVISPASRKAMAAAHAPTSLADLFRIRLFTSAVIAVAAGALIYGTFVAFYPLFGVKILRLTPTQVGYQLALQSLANGAARVPAGRLMNNPGSRRPVIAVGLLGLFGAVAAIPFTSGFWTPAVVAMVGVGCGAAAFSACSIVLAATAGPTGRGAAMGLYSLVVYLGQALGPAVMGSLIQRSGFQIGFAAAAALGLLLLGASLLGVQAWPVNRSRTLPDPRPS